MLYNLYQPAKAARTVGPKALVTETDVPIGRTVRQDFFWKYGEIASQSKMSKLRAFVIGTLLVNGLNFGLNFTVKTDVKFN